ncbi:hypothetical protein GFY24_14230 [Nocardia sp. SYP-A9097]|uniref:hypothetical protein n=1 Tax=Nocardia sp. SYP-A9097 TaxID=2663237 RepID=UPI00129BF73C|nr:hypothetical protein [Nocardia sp. SYP-A9097]MRH88587.1 hypothetical protein [Nocardia sp. SYP-A9097]
MEEVDVLEELVGLPSQLTRLGAAMAAQSGGNIFSVDLNDKRNPRDYMVMHDALDLYARTQRAAVGPDKTNDLRLDLADDADALYADAGYRGTPGAVEDSKPIV